MKRLHIGLTTVLLSTMFWVERVTFTQTIGQYIQFFALPTFRGFNVPCLSHYVLNEDPGYADFDSNAPNSDIFTDTDNEIGLIWMLTLPMMLILMFLTKLSMRLCKMKRDIMITSPNPILIFN